MSRIASRTEWVDYAKAIGILLVVYGHVARGLVEAEIMDESWLFQIVDNVIYTFHMPLFFFLSGLFLLQGIETKGVGRLFSSKVDTIFYPYVIWSVLQGSIEVWLSSYTNGNVTWSEVASLLTSPRAHFWFLYALFLIFFASTLIFSLLKPKYTILVLLASFGLYVLSPGLESPLGFQFVSNYLVFFLMGTVFQQYRADSLINGYMLMLIIAFSVVFQILLILWDQGEVAILFKFIVSAFSLMSVVVLSIWLTRFNLPLLAYIGTSSMAIYLMHILAGSGIRVIMQKLLSIDSVALHLFVGVVMATVLPLLALTVIRLLNIKYLFSAPVSKLWSR